MFRQMKLLTLAGALAASALATSGAQAAGMQWADAVKRLVIV